MKPTLKTGLRNNSISSLNKNNHKSVDLKLSPSLKSNSNLLSPIKILTSPSSKTRSNFDNKNDLTNSKFLNKTKEENSLYEKLIFVIFLENHFDFPDPESKDHFHYQSKTAGSIFVIKSTKRLSGFSSAVQKSYFYSEEKNNQKIIEDEDLTENLSQNLRNIQKSETNNINEENYAKEYNITLEKMDKDDEMLKKAISKDEIPKILQSCLNEKYKMVSCIKLQRKLKRMIAKNEIKFATFKKAMEEMIVSNLTPIEIQTKEIKENEKNKESPINKEINKKNELTVKTEKKIEKKKLNYFLIEKYWYLTIQILNEINPENMKPDLIFDWSFLHSLLKQSLDEIPNRFLHLNLLQTIQKSIISKSLNLKYLSPNIKKKIDYEFLDEFSALIEDSIIDISVLENINTFQNNEMEKKRIDKLYKLYLNFRKDYSNVDTKEEKYLLISNVWNDIIEIIPEINENQDKFKKNGKELRKELDKIFNHDSKNTQNNDSIRDEISNKINDLLMKYFEFNIVQKSNKKLSLAKETLEKLKEVIAVKENKLKILECIKQGRIDKNLFQIKGKNVPKHTIIIGRDCGLYILLNSLQDQSILYEDMPELKKYLKNLEYGGNKNKIIIGKGNFGKIRLALVLSSPLTGNVRLNQGDLICVKKTADFDTLYMHEIRLNTLSDYFSEVDEKYVYSPQIIDMNIIITKEKKHCKGYTMQEFFPIKDATKFFKKNYNIRNWIHLKPYFIDIFNAIIELLNKGIAMTDLKPANTLYDEDYKVGKIIDLAGAVRKKDKNELTICPAIALKEFTILYTAPEILKNYDHDDNLIEPNEKIDLTKALSYSLGKMLFLLVDTQTIKQEIRNEVEKLASKMMHKDPLERLSIEDGYEELKKIGEDLDEIRYFDFVPYMNYLKKNLRNEFETFGLKKNLEEIARLNLPTYVCELDPEKHEINISEIIDLKKTVELDEEKHQMRKSQIMKLKTEADLNPEKNSMRKSQMPDIKKESELDPEKNKIIKSQIIDINKEIDRFLNDYSNLIYKVFLLLGSAGTGKSTVLQLKYWELIKKWKVGDPFPFYMNLATGTNLTQKWKTFTKSIPGGERLMLKLFVGKSGLKLTLLLDSYDESRVKTNLIKEFIEKLQQNKNIKIIITCRSNYISNEEEEKLYFRYYNFPYLKRFIVPFNKTFDTEKEEIFETLINNYCESKFMRDKFQKSFENFKKFNLKEMMISNLMIFMILEILPVLDEKNDDEITNLDIYKLVSTESIEKGRITIPSVLNEKLKKNFGIKEDQEKEFYKNFANDLASQIHGNKRESINNENNKEFFTKYRLNPQKSLKNQSIFNNLNNIFKNDNITSFDIYKHFSTEAIQREKNKIPIFLKTKFQKDFGIKEEQELEFYTNFATDLALQLHTYKTTSINNEYNKEFFTKYNFNPHKSLKNQAIFNLIHTLSLNCEIEENNTVIISFQHETIKNYYLAKLILQEFNLNSTKTLKIHNFVYDTNLIILLTELTRKNENFANFLINYVKNPQFKSDNQDELIDNASSNAITILIGAHVSFLEYNFINVCWRNADIRDGIFNGCDFSCSDLSGINIANCKFEKCIFTNTNLSKVKLGLFPNEEKSQKIVCIDLCVLRSNLHFKNSSTILHNLNDVLDNSPDSPKKKSTEEKGFWIASGISGFFYGKKHIAAKFEINHIIPGEINEPTSIEMDLNSNIINSLCFSPDGNKLACCTKEKDIKIWEKNGPAWDFTAKQLPSLKGHTKSVCSVKFSPSSNYLISGGKDSKILLWRFSKEIEFPFDLKPETTNENLVCFYYDQKNSKIHLDTINSVCFSNDETKILSGSKDNTINILHLENRICQKLTEHKDSVNSISVSRNGEFIVSGSSDKNIIIWGIKGNLIKIIPSHIMAVNSVCFSPDGKLIVSGSQDKSVKLWDRKSGNLLKTFEGHTDSVNCVLFSPHGNAIISGSNDQSIRFWDKNSGKIKKYEGHANIIHSISFSPDGKSVLSGSKDNTVKLWETKTGRLLKTFLGHLKPVTSVGFSPIGNIIYSASRDKLIKFWNKETGKFITNISEIDENVNSAHFSSDEKYIVAGCQDGKLIIWKNKLYYSENEADYKKVDLLVNHKKSVNCVKFAYKTQYYNQVDYTIVSGSSDQTIKIWNFKEKNKWEEEKTINTIYNSVYSIDFSNDGKYIVSGSDDFIVKIWDRKNGELIKDLKGHTDFINSVAFSKCGKFIISGSSDKTVKIWDVKTLELLFSYVGQSDVTSVDCSYYIDYNDDDYFHPKKEKIIAVGSQDIYFLKKSTKIPKLWNLNSVISKNETRMNVLGMKINKKCKISDINKKVLSQQGAIFE